MSSATDLVDDYLARLWQASRRLPHRQRTELLDEIRAHLDEGLRTAGDSEAAVRNVIDDLGEPDDIVAAASPGAGRAAAPGCIAAVAWGALLVVGLLIFVTVLLSPVGGQVCMGGEDSAGNVWESCERTGPPVWVGVVIVVAAGAVPVLAAVRLARIVRADERALTGRSGED